jgi:protein SCO1/2
LRLRQSSTHYAALAFLALALLTACHSAPPTAELKQYQLTGKVVSVDKPNLSVVVNGDEIKGFMGAMAMPYKVKNAADLDSLTPGDAISADLFVQGTDYWIQNIKVTQKSTAAPDKASSELKIPVAGQQVPDFKLLNQNGRHISLNDFRGKALIITFIYTQCPFPDYCPRVTQKFAEINRQLLSNSTLAAKTHLLSISFDPQHDTPKVLRDYGHRSTGNQQPSAFDHWEFAAVPANQLPEMEKFFGLLVAEEKGAITHSLSTTVIGPDGRIYRWYHGNEWTAADILHDAAAALPAS